jgi:hypothetical protein
MPPVHELALLAVALAAFGWLIPRTGPWVAVGSVFVLPLVLCPLWIRSNALGLFPWVKLVSVLVATNWLTLLRLTRLSETTWARVGLLAAFAVNIAEAVLVDVAALSPANLLNVIAGILLLATLPRTAAAVRGTPTNVFVNLGRGWVVAFSVWNWTFVYLNYPVLAGHQLVVLATMLAVGWRDPRRWLQARMYLLSADLIILSTFSSDLLPRWDTTSWRNELLGSILSALAVVTSGAVVVWRKKPWWVWQVCGGASATLHEHPTPGAAR